MFNDHEPRVALVTGANRGLGKELAIKLIERGMNVGILGRDQSGIEAFSAELPGDKCLALAADVANPDDVKAAFEKLDDRFGPLDTLINNAAVYPKTDFLDETPESFMGTIGINLGGVFNCSWFALQRMVPRGTGRIVNVATFAGDGPTQLASAYSVGKGAARILTKAMVADLGDRFPDIVISDWVPGALRTEMGIAEGIDPAVAADWGATLAMAHDRTLNGSLFVEDRERLPFVSRKRRIFNMLIGKSVRARSIDDLI